MNLGDYDGRTALHLAAAEGHFRCVRFLLDTCEVKHDVKDRWGQTPLSEAILFKHTKVASILKRHERLKNIHQQNSRQNDAESPHGEALWRKLVERKMLTPEKEKKKPAVFKFNRAFNKKPEVRDPVGHLDESLKKNLEFRTRTDSLELSTLKESEDERENLSYSTEEEDEINKAAKTIQSKFREYVRRKSIGSIPKENHVNVINICESTDSGLASP